MTTIREHINRLDSIDALDTPEAPRYLRHQPAPSRSLRPVTPPLRPRTPIRVIAVPERDLARLRGRRGHPWREWAAIAGTLLLYAALGWVVVELVLPVVMGSRIP